VIRVLQTSQEVETATQDLQRRGLPTHLTVQKNWDQWLLAQYLSTYDRECQIIDLGCGDYCTLDFLAALNFQHLHGIDLRLKSVSSDRPYQLYAGDLTATPFTDQLFDCAVSISVIEHGVDLSLFFKEVDRILKPDGLLFFTTDYWEPKIQVNPSIQPFGLSWSIFSATEIEAAIALAQNYHFVLESRAEIPACVEPTVHWNEKHYTFIAIALRKSVN
jgi:SAM-dependent methyltransferase